MARHGESIWKRKDGRWEARYRMKNLEGEWNRYRSVYGSTYEEVKKKRSAAIKAAEKALGYEPKDASEHVGSVFRSRILFSEVAKQWLSKTADRWKHSTYVKYKTIYRLHLKESLGSCLLSDTPDLELQKKISGYLSESDLSDSVKKSVYCVANQILIFAAREYSVRVPVLKLEASKQNKEPVETFTKQEQARLLTCIYDNLDLFKIAFLLCLYTGIRLGELCALKWTDFDFDDRTVTVNRTVQRIAVNGHTTKTILMETAPKSASSKRTIPLTTEILGLLKELKGDQPYVFGGNEPMEPRTMQYRFKKILGETGVEDRNFHILRHTFATNCVESGVDVKTLSMILGHANVKVTLNRYVHPTMDSKRRQMGKLPDFYGQICGQVI